MEAVRFAPLGGLTGRTTATTKAKYRISFDFAQGRLLHYATDGDTVRRFGRDDVLFWGCDREGNCKNNSRSPSGMTSKNGNGKGKIQGFFAALRMTTEAGGSASSG
jgi:hypothetical protein